MKTRERFVQRWFPWLSAGYFLLLTIFMTWPLATRMSDQMAGQVGDNIYFVWMIGWFKKALIDLHVNPFNVWFLNYPEGWSLAYTEITPAQLLLAAPFSLIASPTFAYNAAHLLSFLLSGLIMSLWVRRLTDSNGAALLAGTAYAFLPFHFAHFLIGHLNLSGLQWFPLFFWGFFDLLLYPPDGATASGKYQDRVQPAGSAIVKTGIGLGLIALTSQYYLYMTCLIAVFIWVIYTAFINRSIWCDRNFWKHWIFASLVALPLIAIAVAPYVSLAGRGELPDRELGVVRPYSAGLTDFLLPSTDHFVWGSWVGAHFNRDMWVEGTLYVGLVNLGLAVFAWLNRQKTGNRKLLILMGAGGALALLLAMGTDLHWNGAPVEIPTPAFLQGMISRSTIPIPLPGWLLFKYFPLYAKLRALMRFGIFVLLFICTAAGLGAAQVLKRFAPRWKSALTVGLILLVLFDFYPGPYSEFAKVQARPVDAWLASQPGSDAVVQMPFSIAEDQEHTYYTLVHGKPYVGGFFNAFPPAQYKRIKPILNNFPDKESTALLRDLEVHWVLVDPTCYPDWKKTRKEIENFGFELEAEPGGMAVFIPQVEK
ncbi:MAG: YfhO family protein [Leptolinea sp.]|nr:YfhO family protein [Leptolinea sp.]